MTETSPLATVCNVRSEHFDDDQESLADPRSSVGIPLPLVELRISDPEVRRAPHYSPLGLLARFPPASPRRIPSTRPHR